MATPTILHKVAARVKNASLVLTEDSTTWCPFLRKVGGQIIWEFKAAKGLTVSLPSDSADAEPADGDDGGDIKRQIYNVMDSGKVRDRVLSLTDSDLKAAIIEAGASQKEQDLCKAILTSAIPSSHNYLYDEEDHPVKIYSSLGNELLPTPY